MPRADTLRSEQEQRAERERVHSERAAAGLPMHRIAAATDRADRWIAWCGSVVADDAATSDAERVTCSSCRPGPRAVEQADPSPSTPTAPAAERRRSAPLELNSAESVASNPKRFYKTHAIMLHSTHWQTPEQAAPAAAARATCYTYINDGGTDTPPAAAERDDR